MTIDELIDMMDERDPRTRREVSESMGKDRNSIAVTASQLRHGHGTVCVTTLLDIAHAYGWQLRLVGPDGSPSVEVEDYGRG